MPFDLLAGGLVALVILAYLLAVLARPQRF